jgi:hypothetical protein
MQSRQNQASIPHERLMIILAVFHMLIPIAALGSGYILPLLALAVIGSLASIAWMGWQAYRGEFASEAVRREWLLAWRHCRWLLLAYAISAAIMLLGWFLSVLQTDHNMASIMLVIFSRIAAVPTLLMVLVLFVVETSALSESRNIE